MRLQLQCLSVCSLVTPLLVLSLTAGSLLAGPAEYTVTRSIASEGDPVVCTGGSTTVTLQGSGGAGSPTDLFTVREALDAGRRADDVQITNISHGGVFDPNPAPIPIGVFEARSLQVNVPLRGPLLPEAENITVYNGGNAYTSVATTGQDLWEGGDTFEYAFNLVHGDCDVSVRIDDNLHTSVNPATGADTGILNGVGCWGKWGLMARDATGPLTFDETTMVMSAHHGPSGTPHQDPGATHPCPITGQATSGSLWRRDNNLVGEFNACPHADYLRLVRRGDNFFTYSATHALGSPEALALEADPTNDAHWDCESTSASFPTADGRSFFVGFSNQDHADNGTQRNQVDFTVLNWVEPGGFTGEGKEVRWSNITRANLDEGLSYTADVTPGTGSASLSVSGLYGPSIAAPPGLQKGIAGDPSVIQGPALAEIIQAPSVGGLNFQGIGAAAGGSLIADGSLLTMEGRGGDIWSDSDSFAFAYQRVTGDFDATIHVVFRDLSNTGPFAKHGLMMRQTCEAGSINEAVLSRQTPGNIPGGGPRLQYRLNHLASGGTLEPFQVVGGTVPGETDPLFPDFYRLIRTGSQVTGYVAYEDPENEGVPFHWCYVGPRNVQGRPDDQFVGMASTSQSPQPLIFGFTFDVDSYAPATLDPPVEGATLLTRDFDADAGGEPPPGAFHGTLGTGGFDPVVTNGRLRMTEDGTEDSASAVWFSDPALADILDTGFVAEYDVFVTKEGLPDPDPIGVLPGEGGMFVVVGGASDLFSSGCPGLDEGTVPLELPITEVIGMEDSCCAGFNMTQRNDGGTPDPADDVYTNINASGGAIWENCDRFSYDYTEVTGDFDIVTEIISYDHETGNGQWSKWGLMAREGAGAPADNDRYIAVHNTGPAAVHGTVFTVRRNLEGCGGMSQESFRGATNSTFLRLTRRGDTIQGFASDDPELGLGGSLDRNNDCNWIRGPSATLQNLEEALNVGFLNSEEQDAGVNFNTVTYRILGPNPSGDVNTGGAFRTNLVGFPDQLGFGGGRGDAQPFAKGLTGASSCHPHFGVEVDTQESMTSNNEGAGAPTNVGQYHIGVNTGGLTDSRQTSDNFGVDAENLPDIFASGGVHMRVEYRPNGEIEVHATAGSGGGAGAPDPNDRVISTFIPPLSLGAGLADPIVGFVASNHLGGSQTLEFDNLSIRALGSAGGSFKRGDGDASGTLNINDPIFNLIFQFLGGVTPVCKDALDTDDSGTVTINDPIISLTFQFLGGVTIPLPGPDACGPDPTMDNEDCAAYPQDKC